MNLLESIRIENGIFYHLAYHEQRMRQAQQKLLGKVTIDRLTDHIVIPPFAQQGLFKCRVIYRRVIKRIEFVPYQHKTIRTLRRVNGDHIDYAHKYEDRQVLDELFAQRDGCDDVLIIREGRVTDTSYANVLFYDGRRWLTPKRPLLRGTQRQYLLEQKLIDEAVIKEKDLPYFRYFQVINAFRPLADIGYPISYIV